MRAHQGLRNAGAGTPPPMWKTPCRNRRADANLTRATIRAFVASRNRQGATTGLFSPTGVAYAGEQGEVSLRVAPAPR